MIYRFLGDNQIEQIFLGFENINFQLLCLGRNPIKRITATQAMFESFASTPTPPFINNVSVCGPLSTYPNLACHGKCANLGALSVSIIENAQADSKLGYISDPSTPPPPSGNNVNSTLYISIAVFCIALVIIIAALFLETKRRKRLEEEEHWEMMERSPGGSLARESIEVTHDIRYDPEYIGTFTPLVSKTRWPLL